MASSTQATRADSRRETVTRLQEDLRRCVVRADALGLTAIAIHLQRSLDELAMMEG